MQRASLPRYVTLRQLSVADKPLQFHAANRVRKVYANFRPTKKVEHSHVFSPQCVKQLYCSVLILRGDELTQERDFHIQTTEKVAGNDRCLIEIKKRKKGPLYHFSNLSVILVQKK